MVIAVLATVLFMCIREHMGSLGSSKKGHEEKELLEQDSGASASG